MLREQPLARFRAKVTVLNDGCWRWTAACNDDGYPQLSVDGRTVYAHRFAYETFIGPIPDDRPHLDHQCRRRWCVNPSHLEPVTLAENNRRAVGDTCRLGHPYSPHYGVRVCRICRDARRRQRGRERPLNAEERRKHAARKRVHRAIRRGQLAHPNVLPCLDCGHVHLPGERRHEYDHRHGYAPDADGLVEPVCTTCHHRRSRDRKETVR